jgi:hypothetical protein
MSARWKRWLRIEGVGGKGATQTLVDTDRLEIGCVLPTIAKK